MLEAVDTSIKVEKGEYEERLPLLKTRFRELQQHARERHVPIVVAFEGWDTAGKGDVIQHVTEVLDPRGFYVRYTGSPTAEERQHPWLKRFWTQLPHRGQIAIFERSWYTRVLQERVERTVRPQRWKQAYEEIRQFERLLADDGHVLIKFWLHITEGEQRRRLKAARRDPFRRFTVTEEEWMRHGKYKQYLDAAEDMIRETDAESAPWTVVEAGDKRHRRLKVLDEISRRVDEALERLEHRPKSPPSRIEVVGQPEPGPLDKVDLTKTLKEGKYATRLRDAQLRLRMIQQEAYRADVGIAVVYEGWDAAGKGGSIRRLTATLDPRGYTVVPVGKPTQEELAHNYLWRFWKEVPRRGHMTIFDRSWYGRPLVERIEGFCTVEEARRSYREIDEFELQLVRSDVAVAKFWIHISFEEQLRRFESRRESPHKAWKLNDEDWRNRDKWDQYVVAVNDTIRKTSSEHAPWTVIEGNCKRWARVRAIETVCEVWEHAIERKQRF